MSDEPDPPIQAWLAEHFPDALPWQVHLMGAMYSAREQGRTFMVQRPRRNGMNTVREMLHQRLMESGEPTWTVPEDPLDTTAWIPAEVWDAAVEPEPVDALEAAVRAQVHAGEPETGYDFDDPTFPDCPHPWCDEHWHGLAITRRMWEMREREEIDPDYRYTTDDSEVLCPGSLFEGEFTPPAPPERRPYDRPGSLVIVDETHLLTPEDTERLRQVMARSRGVSAIAFYASTTDDSSSSAQP